ncbi:MAG: hypothetical protein KatS3mg057_2070 [Herpetosiphonaceae bacterium]|nr:MAG: hypothetical protein KatS3mg057_2070 [Herpetosiphonaceae bacterium]
MKKPALYIMASFVAMTAIGLCIVLYPLLPPGRMLLDRFIYNHANRNLVNIQIKEKHNVAGGTIVLYTAEYQRDTLLRPVVGYMFIKQKIFDWIYIQGDFIEDTSQNAVKSYFNSMSVQIKLKTGVYFTVFGHIFSEKINRIDILLGNGKIYTVQPKNGSYLSMIADNSPPCRIIAYGRDNQLLEQHTTAFDCITLDQ